MVFECQTSLCKSNRFVIVTTLMARTRKHRQMSEPSRQNYEGQSWFCCNPWAKAMSRPSPPWATTHMVNTCCCQMDGSKQTHMDVQGGSCLNAATLSTCRCLSHWRKEEKNRFFTVIPQRNPQRTPLQKREADAQPEVVCLLPGSRRGQACLTMQPSCQLIYKWSERMIQPKEKNGKTCRCPSRFHWHALYRAGRTPKWSEPVLFGVKPRCTTAGPQLWVPLQKSLRLTWRRIVCLNHKANVW